MQRSITIAAVLAALVASSTLAQDLPGDPAKGHELAREVCAECHYVEREEVDRYVFEAPDFVDIARDSDHTELSLRVFLVTPHLTMPNLILTKPQRDDVISWILSLRQK